MPGCFRLIEHIRITQLKFNAVDEGSISLIESSIIITVRWLLREAKIIGTTTILRMERTGYVTWRKQKKVKLLKVIRIRGQYHVFKILSFSQSSIKSSAGGV